MLRYHRSTLLPIHPILPICPNFQFQQASFCLPSMWVLCAFFETAITTTKPASCLFCIKPAENQPSTQSTIPPLRAPQRHICRRHPCPPRPFTLLNPLSLSPVCVAIRSRQAQSRPLAPSRPPPITTFFVCFHQTGVSGRLTAFMLDFLIRISLSLA